MAKLTIKDEQGRERLHELVDDTTTIGRASANVIQITDEKASRNHFKIAKDGEFFKVIDLGSTNGVRLNGEKIQADTLLRTGDQMSVGKTTFTYDGPGPEAPKKASRAPAKAQMVPSGGGGLPASASAMTRADTMDFDLRAGRISSVTEELPAAVPGEPPPEPEAPGPKYVLRVLEGRNPGETYEFSNKPLTIGRHINNTIQIIDEAASNYHAEIVREPIGFVLSDLSSTNGTKARQKNKTEFEKIVKTPLAVGMQIRIGKTVLEFQNVGKPVADEALFGTIALDPDKVDAKLPDASPQRQGVPKVALAAMVVGLFITIVGLMVKFLPSDKPQEVVKPVIKAPVQVQNFITNGDFEKGPDDLGVPFDFRVEKPPGVRIAVLTDAQRTGSSEAKQALGLQISKSNAKSPSALAAVEVADSFPVDPGSVYEFKGAMRNDGDGLFGLRVTWIQGERTLSEHPVVLKDSQDWKEKTVLLTPPSWAQRARAGVFSQGKEGKASFDELSFQLKPGAEPNPQPSIAFGGVSVDFQGTKGSFCATVQVTPQNQQIVEDGTLLLVSPDGNAACELASAVEPEITQEAARASYKGRIYDFALQELTDYRIQAQHGAAGIDLRAAVDVLPDGGKPQLRFYVVGPAAQGEIEVAKPGGNEFERVQPTEEKSLSGIQGLLFNAGKAPQLDVSFGAPVDVELKREGLRRRVIVRFKNELNVSLAPESVGHKQKMTALVNALQKSLQEKNWGEVETKLKLLSDTYAGRFPQAADEANKAKQQYDTVWNNAQAEIKKAMDALRNTKSAAATENAHKVVDRHVAQWTGSAKLDELKELHAAIDDIKKAGQTENAETDAEASYQMALTHFNNKVYSAAKSYLQTKIINHEVNSKTKVAEKAKELLAKVIAREQRQDELDRIERTLLDRTKNHIQLKDYKKAIDLVENDPEYQANKDDLTEIQSRLMAWKKKRGDRD